MTRYSRPVNRVSWNKTVGADQGNRFRKEQSRWQQYRYCNPGFRIAETNDFDNRVIAAVDFNRRRHLRLQRSRNPRRGIAAGNGKYKGTSYAGIATGANLINVKVLIQEGSGDAGTIIEASMLGNQKQESLQHSCNESQPGYAVTESYKEDPLCQAVEQAVEAGIVVVAAAGNSGKTLNGTPLFGAIHSPGNDPYVITVGAVKHNDTVSRGDDSG